MTRELTRKLKPLFKNTKKKSKNNTVSLSLEDLKELQKEMEEMKLMLKNYEGGSVFIYSKMTALFDKIRSELRRLAGEQQALAHKVEDEISALKLHIEKQDKNKERLVTHKVQDLIDQHHKMNEKYSYQLKDLCRSLTMQSEQVWKLEDKVQEIKESVSAPDKPSL